VNSGELQREIGYTFKNKALLCTALTHSSFTNEKDESCDRSNERLEFLGDAFFDAIISEELYRRLGSAGEGKLTKLRALVVCEKSLARYGKQINIGRYMFLGKGEECTGGRERDALIADAFEAVMGAVFLDGGYPAVKEGVLKLFKDRIDDAVSGRLNTDYKTALQEKLQAAGEAKISYIVRKEEGPDHDKTFFVDLFCENRLSGAGRGKSKKEAEQNAAREALERGVGSCTSKE